MRDLRNMKGPGQLTGPLQVQSSLRSFRSVLIVTRCTLEETQNELQDQADTAGKNQHVAEQRQPPRLIRVVHPTNKNRYPRYQRRQAENRAEHAET